MLLPDKHIKIGESILGLSALIVANLKRPIPFDRLMAMLEPKFETSEWPAYHNTETVSPALCFLYSIGIVDVRHDADVYRCE